MKNKRHIPRRRGNSDESEENLRGRLRELSKELESSKRYAKSLEKKIERLLGNQQLESVEDPLEKRSAQAVCKNCGKDGHIRETKIWTPSGDVVWLICQLCKDRERKK